MSFKLPFRPKDGLEFTAAEAVKIMTSHPKPGPPAAAMGRNSDPENEGFKSADATSEV